MPLSDSDADKLCRGRIVRLADVIDSTGTYRAGPHFAIVLDSAEKILANAQARVVVVSSNDIKDKTYLVPVPKKTGLKGNVICSWYPVVPEAQMDAIWNPSQPPLTEADLLPIVAMIVRHDQDTKRPKKK